MSHWFVDNKFIIHFGSDRTAKSILFVTNKETK